MDCVSFVTSSDVSSGEQRNSQRAPDSHGSWNAHTCEDSVAQPSSVSTVLPVHLCSNYVPCVSCGGLSFLTGLPRAFHLDATASLMSSVLHKDVCVDLPGWAARSRCRVVGTGEAGAGKSPCFDPNRQLLLGIYRRRGAPVTGVLKTIFTYWKVPRTQLCSIEFAMLKGVVSSPQERQAPDDVLLGRPQVRARKQRASGHWRTCVVGDNAGPSKKETTSRPG